MIIVERDNSVYVGRHEGRHIIDTKHAIDRFVDRGRFDSQAGKQEFKGKVIWVIENAIDKILKQHRDTSGTYVVHSQSTGIGVVLGWREEGDPRYRDGNNHAIIITILPIKSRHTASDPRDTLLIVEVRDQIEQFLRENNIVKTNKALQETVLDDEGVYSSVKVEELDLDLLFYEGGLYDILGTDIVVE